MSGKYRDESQTYEIDLTKAFWSIGDLQDKFRSAGNFLNAVDWVVETPTALMLIEFKNYSKSQGVIAEREKFYQNILRKYYFTAYYLLSCGKEKAMDYIFIAEAPNLDKVIGKRAKSAIKRRLPFTLHENNGEIIKGIINDFKILSVAEWNNEFPLFPLSKCAEFQQSNNPQV